MSSSEGAGRDFSDDEGEDGAGAVHAELLTVCGPDSLSVTATLFPVLMLAPRLAEPGSAHYDRAISPSRRAVASPGNPILGVGHSNHPVDRSRSCADALALSSLPS